MDKEGERQPKGGADLSLGVVTKFHWLVLTIVATLITSSTLVRISDLDDTFKLSYNVASVIMIFAIVMFEEWRIYHSEPDYEKLCKELEKK